MRKSILTMAVAALMTGAISTSYAQNADKKEIAASGNTQTAQKDGSPEIQKFRKDSEMKIKNIDNIIGDLKVYFYQNKIKDKEGFQNNLNVLEEKNDGLLTKLAGYKNDQNTLTSFKLEINTTMDELGKSLKEFRSKNK
jgi:hypothetical protein